MVKSDYMIWLQATGIHKKCPVLRIEVDANINHIDL